MIDHEHLRTVSQETLENFEAIASAAEKKLGAGAAAGRDVLIESKPMLTHLQLNNCGAPGAHHRRGVSALSSMSTADISGSEPLRLPQTVLSASVASQAHTMVVMGVLHEALKP